MIIFQSLTLFQLTTVIGKIQLERLLNEQTWKLNGMKADLEQLNKRKKHFVIMRGAQVM